MNKIYSNQEVASQRIDEIEVLSSSQESDKTVGKLCCTPRYRRATLVGCFFAVFQQLTGINVIMFYSNMLFKGLSMSNTTITALIGIVNFVTTIIGFLFLMCLGRKTIMVIFSALMSVTLLLLSYFTF